MNNSRWGTIFIRSRVWPLTTVLVLFVLWVGSLFMLLSSIKVAEKMKVYGTFSACESCDSSNEKGGTKLCFTGRVLDGTITAKQFETIALKREVGPGNDFESLEAAVEQWRSDATEVSFCIGVSKRFVTEPLALGVEEQYTVSVREESLLTVLLRQV